MVTVFLIGLAAITPSRAQFTGKAAFLVIFLAYIVVKMGDIVLTVSPVSI